MPGLVPGMFFFTTALIDTTWHATNIRQAEQSGQTLDQIAIRLAW
jgi:hypothetical protein